MNWKTLIAGGVAAAAVGCGGKADLPPTTDPDAIRREQERIRNEIPGVSGDYKKDAIRQEQLKRQHQP